MLFMNSVEIDFAVSQYAAHPVKGPASRLLRRLRDETNERSDGWHSWPAPCKAARQLQELLQERDESKVTKARFDKALAPIKAFCTRHAKDGFSFDRLLA